MKRVVGLEELPAPGEPLTPKINPTNKAALDEEIEERRKRIQAKLSKPRLKELNQRYRELHALLNGKPKRSLWQRVMSFFTRVYPPKYNQLIATRWELWQEYKQLQKELKRSISPRKERLIARRTEIRNAGKEINHQIAKLTPFAKEFEAIKQRLAAHAAVVAWEKEDSENREAFLREARTWEEQINAVFRQYPKLHHAGTDSRGDWFCEIPIIEHITFKEDKALFKIKTAGQTFFERIFGRWHSELPYGVNIVDLYSEDTLENLSAACDRIVTVERSKAGRGFYYAISRLDSPDGIPAKVLYSKCVDYYPAAEHAKTPWAAGVTADRKVTWFNMEDTPHILIAGSTKSGKSNHVNQMIATFVTLNSPQELQLLLVDLKGGVEFTHWSGIAHSMRPMIKSSDDVLDALLWLRSIMEERLARFAESKSKNLETFNQKHPNDKLPRILCIVDELATLIGLGELTTSIHNELRVLSSQGRAVGVHLILCTQHSSSNILPGEIKTNMAMRISGKMPSHTASMVILDSVTAATLPPVPGRMVFSVGRFEVVAQSPFIPDEEVARAVSLSQQYSETAIEGKPETNLPSPRFGREQFIAISISQLNGKMSPSVIHKLVGNTTATRRQIDRIYHDVLEETGGIGGIISYGGSSYRIGKDRKTYTLNLVEPTNDDTDTSEFNTIDVPEELEEVDQP